MKRKIKRNNKEKQRDNHNYNIKSNNKEKHNDTIKEKNLNANKGERNNRKQIFRSRELLNFQPRYNME